MSSSSLFQSYNKQTAILLVDASGSTKSTFKGTQSIFEVMATVCSELDHPAFRVLFWNSPGSDDEKFPNGVRIIPFVVKPETLQTTFKMVAGTLRDGCTHTNIAFKYIPAEWMKEDTHGSGSGSPMVYLVTDGEITSGRFAGVDVKTDLRDEIGKFKGRLAIITVEKKQIDHSQQETVGNMAGGDVFGVIQEAKLTNKITQFVSYTLPQTARAKKLSRFVHINRNDPPKGFIPYEQQYFSELKMPEFFQFIRAELREVKDDESRQLQIAQNLANTLNYATKDKPARLVNDIVANFAQLFTIDKNVIQYMLTEAIERERQGTAGVYANYRKNLKDFFKEASRLLEVDVRRAIGLNFDGHFVTFPVNGRVLTGSGQLINQPIQIAKTKYPNASYNTIPIFTEGARRDSADAKMSSTDEPSIQEQCLRQWTRSIYARLYLTNAVNDEIIYLVLGDMYIVNQSPNAPDRVKRAYVNLGRAMLRKKRLNSMQTELDRLESGELPVPNSGKINDFFILMEVVAKKLKITTKPMRLWFEICGVLGGKIKEMQQPHCVRQTEQWGDIAFTPYQFDTIPDECNLDYTCLVTLEDISTVGGYRMNIHRRVTGTDCHPVYLFSEAGKTQLVRSSNCACPICYTPIAPDQFTKVGPRAEFKLHESYAANPFLRGSSFEDEKEAAKDALTDVKTQNGTNGHTRRQKGRKGAKTSATTGHVQDVKDVRGTPGKLVVMKGVVGCGKSTLAEQIKQQVEARGGTCFIEGVDKYCNTGLAINAAIPKIEQALRAALTSNAADKVVVIDTCGEHNNGQNQTKYFGVNFQGWQKIDLMPNFDPNNVPGYLAWSLWNVLLRSRPTMNSTFHLNPETATVLTCVNVHQKKARLLGWEKHWKFTNVTDAKDVEPLARQFKPIAIDVSYI